MKEPTYYTPNLEDLFVGYKCELKGWEDQVTWYGTVLEKRMMSDIDLAKTRTKYLDQADIKKELVPLGFKWSTYDRCWTKPAPKEHYHYEVYLHEDARILNILIQPDFLYQGKCPSVNEFRKILKAIGICQEKTMS